MASAQTISGHLMGCMGPYLLLTVSGWLDPGGIVSPTDRVAAGGPAKLVGCIR